MHLKPGHSLGHNPLGGWIVVLLLAMLLAIAATGVFGAAREPGALLDGLVDRQTSAIFREVHETLANLLYFVVALHVAGVLFDWLLTSDNLIRAMVDGRKRLPEGAVATDARGGGLATAAVVAAVLAALGVLLVANTSF